MILTSGSGIGVKSCFAKIRKVLGWKPDVTLEQGIEKTIDWYLANRAWWEPKIWMRHVEISTPEGKKELH